MSEQQPEPPPVVHEPAEADFSMHPPAPEIPGKDSIPIPVGLEAQRQQQLREGNSDG